MSRLRSPNTARYARPTAGSPESQSSGIPSPSPRLSNRLPTSRSSHASPSPRHGAAGKSEVGSLKKEMGSSVGLRLEDVDTADVDKLRAAASGAIKMQARLREVEVDRAKELRELQLMMSNLQRKEEELSKYVTAVQKRRQETDPYEKAHVRIAELEKELKEALDQSTMDAEHRGLREESANLNSLFARIEAAVQRVRKAEQCVYSGTDDEMAKLQETETQAKLDKEEVAKVTEELLAETECLKMQLSSETNKRKKLHNQLVNLRGAIRVFSRIRPMLNAAGEDIDGEISTEVDEATDSIAVHGARANCHRPQDVKEKKFQFDRVFPMNCTQEAIYDETSPVVTSVMDGYNVCIFAYGQTGSGKTHTMEGTEQKRGVNYRTLKELFEIAHIRRAQMEFEFKVSLVEVYNEEVRDLLQEYVPEVTWTTHGKGSSRPHLELRVQPDGRVDIPGLTTTKVSSVEEAWGILQKASTVRSSGETKSNAHSSRSHCLLRVSVKGYNKLNKDTMLAKLWLVDLAGSERVGKSEAQGARLKEAQYINRSLSALGDCIYALATKSNHVPYRNSKLTHMLADSLGGDSKTVMIVNVSPDLYDIGETTCSLNFASRVRGVEMGPAKRHVESNVSEVQKAKMQAHDLKAQVEELQEVKISQQKKIRQVITEQDSLRESARKAEKAKARLEKKLAKLQEKLCADQQEDLEDDDEDEEESVHDYSHGAMPFLAPTDHPVYKATDPNVAPTPRSAALAQQLQSIVGESLKVRTTDSGATEQVTVLATSAKVKLSNPKSDTFRARFADFRTKPDRPDVLEEDEPVMECQVKAAKKKSSIRKWIGFF